MTKHRIDWLPAGIITTGVGLALVPFVVALPSTLVAMLLGVSIAARSIAPVHHHCHAHFRIFRSRWLNRAYDGILMLAAGNTTALWELQHVRGHHRAVLDPRHDPANTRRFGGDDGLLHRAVFTIAGDALSFSDALRIARHQRDAERQVRRLWGQLVVQLVILGVLLVWNARLALLGFVLPNVALRWFVFWFSYSQHHEAPLEDIYSSSITRFGWTNRVFLNVGHHTAHHEKPTLHWSQLPQRTAKILDRIPESCLRAS